MQYRVLAKPAAIARGRRFGRALGAALLALALACGAYAADPPAPKSLLSDETLARYRSGQWCRDGRAYDEIVAMLRAEAGAARSARFLQHADATPLGLRIATDYDRAAQVAAARNCPEQARQFWTYLLDDYQGPEFAALRARAEAGLRAVPSAPASGGAPR